MREREQKKKNALQSWMQVRLRIERVKKRLMEGDLVVWQRLFKGESRQQERPSEQDHFGFLTS